MTEISATLPPVKVESGFWEKLSDPAIKGALFKVLSCLSFSGVNGVIRHFSIAAEQSGATPMPAPELALFESLFGLLFILPWILTTGKSAFQATNLPLYFARAIAASCGIILWFTALSKMPIVQVVAFKYTSPFFLILGAKFFLGEKCGWARAIAIATAIFGALLITGHKFCEDNICLSDVTLLALIPMGATACYAASAVLGKKLVKNDPPQTVILYLLIITIPIFAAASSYQWVTPETWQWPWLMITGILLAAAYIFLQHAYVAADVTYLVPMSFTRLIAGAAIGMLFFNEWPTLWTWVGSFFILIATISLCNHEVKRKRKKKQEKLQPA